MAASQGFKQQCPSCEAMVPIKNRNLIGKKIDCHKCKYRFVVEDPGADEDEAEAPEEVKAGAGKKVKAGAAAGGAKTAIKSAVNGKGGTAVKKKPGLRSRDDDDEDGEGAPAKKKGGSTTLILGLVLGGVALLLLVVGGVLLFGGGGTQQAKVTPPKNPSTPQKPDNPQEEKKEPEAAPTVSTSDITNLLPNETDLVGTINIERLLNSNMGREGLGAPGGFTPESFQKRMGFPLQEVKKVVVGVGIPAAGPIWHFSVLRTTKAVSLENLVKNLSLVEAKEPIEEQKYYTVNAEVEGLGRFLFGENKPANPLTFHLYDDQTLVFAHAPAMEGFLKAKRQPRLQSKMPEQPAGGEGNEGQGPGQGFPGMGGQFPGRGGPPNGFPGGGGPPGQGGPGGPGGPGGGGLQQQRPGTAGGGGNTPVAEGATPGPNNQPGMPMQGRPGFGQSLGNVPQISSSYLTIRPAMKTVMDRVEEGKTPVIFSLCVEGRFGANVVQRIESMTGLGKLDQIDRHMDAFIALAASVQQLTNNKFTGLVAAECKSEDTAQMIDKAAPVLGPELAQEVGKKLALNITYGDTNPFLPGGFQPGGGGPGGNFQGMQGGSRPPPGVGMGQLGGGLGPMQPGVGAGQQGGNLGPMQPGFGAGGFGPQQPGFGQQGGPQGGPPGGPPRSSNGTLSLKLKSPTTVLLTCDITLNDAAYDKVAGQARAELLKEKAQREMTGRSRVHELARALRDYTAAKQAFPRGTLDRPTSIDRAGLAWRPDQRISWMLEILPFLGGGELTGVLKQIDPRKSWQEDENASVAQMLIPQFVAHDYPASTWWGPYPMVLVPLANTHFVGMAGIGSEAADYEPKDAAVAKKIGIFGYDRITNLADIKDGPANTIAVIQVPAEYRTPWMAGGGSTIRGVPETESIRPFVCATYNGQRGTFAIMADGKVRFLAETISDKDFQALCTIAGGETVDLDKVAPEVPAPNQSELKTKVPEAGEPAKEEPKTTPATVPPMKEETKPPVSEKRGGDMDAKVLAALSNNCAMCHTGPKAKKVQIFLSEGVVNTNAPKDKMTEMLASGKMPPRGKPRPSDADLAALQGWLNGTK